MAGSLLVLAILASITLPSVSVHGCETGHEPRTWTQEELDELNHKWGTDVRRHSPTAGSVAAPLTSTPSGHSPASTFAQLPHVRCLTDPQGPEAAYDIAILGVPFDTATSYRPGARFGPRAIRAASARQISFRGWNPRVGINPYADWARVLDCGDIPVTPVDNAVAVRQMEGAFKELLRRRPASARGSTRRIGECRIEVPKIVALGGDHSIALPALRALKEVYGRPLRVLHFDAHLDTWHPAKYPSAWTTEQAHFNHGSMFWLAGNEGLIANASTHTTSSASSSTRSVHAGLRTRLSGPGDIDDDDAQNWLRISADDMDEPHSPSGRGGGTAGIISTILSTLGTGDPVYLSVDIDVLDPAFAPGTGTPEPGGWTTRELIRILRGIWQLNVVGADVVEVAPAYEAGFGEATALAAAQVTYEIITSMVLGAAGRLRRTSTGPATAGREQRMSCKRKIAADGAGITWSWY